MEEGAMTTTTTTKLGGSLKVPSVQELARQNPATVPHRYLRPDLNPPFLFHSSPEKEEIPVIDMQILLSAIAGDSNSELQKLDFACKEWGFFQVINHGVSNWVMDKIKLETGRFFKLSMEEKKKYEQEPGDLQGYGQAFVVSEEQKLDWADMFYFVTQPTHLRKPHLFPNFPTSFREAVDEYSREVKKLAMKILTQMAKALGIKMEEINEMFGEEGFQAMRMNYYPPCPEPEKVIGLCPHSDSVGITILLQVSEVEGLQVKKDGYWVPVIPLPNAFIVNIGDILEVVTNGMYKSNEHRAIVNGEKERISIATFLTPNIEGEMGPSPSLITPENPPKFKWIGMAEYMRGLFARKLDGKSYVDAMKL